jgi:hypothetical protein
MCYIISNNNISEFWNLSICWHVHDIILLPKMKKILWHMICCYQKVHFTYTPNASYYIMQAPGGLLFPDKASLYICAIEDRQYKEEKIFCKLMSILYIRGRGWYIKSSGVGLVV